MKKKLLLLNVPDSELRNELDLYVSKSIDIGEYSNIDAEAFTADPEQFQNSILVLRVNSQYELTQALAVLEVALPYIKTKKIFPIALISPSDTLGVDSLRDYRCFNQFALTVSPDKVIGKINSSLVAQKLSQNYAENIQNLAQVQDINLDSGDLVVSISNTESSTDNCLIEAVEDNEIELSLSAEVSFAIDQQVEVTVLFRYDKCKVELALEGIVAENEQTGATQSLLLRIPEDSAKNLDQFMALYQKRQKNIHEFFTLAKGH